MYIYRYKNGTYIVTYNHEELYGEINLFKIVEFIYMIMKKHIYNCWRLTYIGYCMLKLIMVQLLKVMQNLLPTYIICKKTHIMM